MKTFISNLHSHLIPGRNISDTITTELYVFVRNQGIEKNGLPGIRSDRHPHLCGACSAGIGQTVPPPGRSLTNPNLQPKDKYSRTNHSYIYILIKTTYKTREKQSKPKSDTSKRGVRLPQTKTQTYSLIYENKFPKQNFRNASFG